jgi:hypothetical protein
LAGTLVGTVTTLVATVNKATGSKSLSGSHGSLAVMAGLPTWYAEYEISSV